jgi:hypothetical protein
MNAANRRRINPWVVFAPWVGMSVALAGAACGSGGKASSGAAQIPPAEEPPWTKAATISPDAGLERGQPRADPSTDPGTDSTNESR